MARQLLNRRGHLQENHYGNGELGDVHFTTTGITQANGTVDIDTLLTTGSKAGGPGASSYGTGTNAPPGALVYEFTVPSKNGAYDGDMFMAQFLSLIIDATVWVTVDQPNRGLFVYVDGDCTINGILSMSCRGAFADPTAVGGSDTAAVDASGIQLPIIKAGETDTLAAANFAGCGTPAVNAVANQEGISGNGKTYSFVRKGADPNATNDDGAYGSCFSGGAAGGGDSGAGDSNDGQSGTTGQTGGGGDGENGISGRGEGVNWGGSGGGGISPGDAGGAGNPGGAGDTGAPNGSNGIGGLIFLIVNGDLAFGASSEVVARGSRGGVYTGVGFSGGSSGGGNILILYAGTLTDGGVSASAAGGPAVAGRSAPPGAGGDGSVQGPTKIDR